VFVVIFRAETAGLDKEYFRMAARLRDLALSEFGCAEFRTVSEGTTEVALSYWHDLESIRAWKRHSDHVIAQELGRQRWYASYAVQIARVEREYRWP
jgi:heme-degrading monooxygenase HmoA